MPERKPRTRDREHRTHRTQGANAPNARHTDAKHRSSLPANMSKMSPWACMAANSPSSSGLVRVFSSNLGGGVGDLALQLLRACRRRLRRGCAEQGRGGHARGGHPPTLVPPAHNTQTQRFGMQLRHAASARRFTTRAMQARRLGTQPRHALAPACRARAGSARSLSQSRP